MKFNSQICTTREQSERLLALGLKKETADMVWRYSNTIKGKDIYDPVSQPCDDAAQKARWIELCEKADYLSHWFKPDGSPMTAEEVYEAVWGKDIPAWSLHRLIEMMPPSIRDRRQYSLVYDIHRDWLAYLSYGTNVRYLWDDQELNPYDAFIDCIEWLIKEGYFNKEYLV